MTVVNLNTKKVSVNTNICMNENLLDGISIGLERFTPSVVEHSGRSCQMSALFNGRYQKILATQIEFSIRFRYAVRNERCLSFLYTKPVSVMSSPTLFDISNIF